MIPRHQLAVSPRISPASLLRAGAAALAPGSSGIVATAEALRHAFGVADCVLTDSGTSAIVLALRLMLPDGGIVALPGYGCVDFAAAVRFAGARVRLYDIDPTTLSPDLESLERTLRRGVDVVLVAHYYGYPADMRPVCALASRYGVPVIEDAAQGAGASIESDKLGQFGDLSVLSFGRGKGLFGGRGGALLAPSSEWSRRLASIPPLHTVRGGRELAVSMAQWVLARPQLYALPASIPSLHLGEMVYHPAHEPSGLSRAAAALVRSALLSQPEALRMRREKAARLERVVGSSGGDLRLIRPIDGARPGYLRLAVLDVSGTRGAAPRLGVMRGYPRALNQQQELRAHLVPGEPHTPGALELCTTLFTLPTHCGLRERDLLDLEGWLARPSLSRSIAVAGAGSGGGQVTAARSASSARQASLS